MTELPETISALYPFEQNDFQCSGGRMNYIDTRAGEANRAGERVVVLLHGNPSWSFLWRDLIRALAAEGVRCIAPDHLGMGLSEKPNRYFTLAERILHIEELLAHLKIEKFSLCLHDWGGAIGCGIAENVPANIEKLVIMNTAAFRSKKIPRRIALCKFGVFGAFLVKYFNAFARPATFMSVEKKLSPAVKAGFLFPYRKARERTAIANFVRDIPLDTKHPSYATLLRIEQNLEKLTGMPMFIAWGGKDFCFDATFFEQWKTRFPNAKRLFCEDAGHYLLEDAGTRIIPQVCRFLND